MEPPPEHPDSWPPPDHPWFWRSLSEVYGQLSATPLQPQPPADSPPPPPSDHPWFQVSPHETDHEPEKEVSQAESEKAKQAESEKEADLQTKAWWANAVSETGRIKEEQEALMKGPPDDTFRVRSTSHGRSTDLSRSEIELLRHEQMISDWCDKSWKQRSPNPDPDDRPGFWRGQAYRAGTNTFRNRGGKHRDRWAEYIKKEKGKGKGTGQGGSSSSSQPPPPPPPQHEPPPPPPQHELSHPWMWDWNEL